MSEMSKKIEKIIRTYLISNDCRGDIDCSKLKNMKELKVICKDKEGRVIGIITDKRIFKYCYSKNAMETTDYELELYVELYNKDESRYLVMYKDAILNNEMPQDMNKKINEWKAEYNIEMVADYGTIDDVLAELKEHRKYICGLLL